MQRALLFMLAAASDHEGHDVFFNFIPSTVPSGTAGCCDCGDPLAWKPEGFCKRHKANNGKDFIFNMILDMKPYNNQNQSDA